MNLKSKTITLQELARFGDVSCINEQAKTLVKQQANSWDLAANNYFNLTRVENKTFDFGHFKIEAQYNPERMRSSAAKTDEKTISERPCFLCLENLPSEQRGIPFQTDYLILINPFPIFQQHLTISRLGHTPQQIQSYFTDMLDLSSALPDFTIFFNGPQTGASAPDHFHFQAATKGKMPVEQEFESLAKNYSEVIFQHKNTTVLSIENFMRPFFAIVSDDKDEIQRQFQMIYKNLKSENLEEPKMNVLCNFENNKWRATVFPREKQRPSHFFRNDESRIVIGPAAVEFGGILILPRKEDFEKITKKEIQEIFEEVTVDKKEFKNLCKQLKIE
ncbi:MAG TPA: DUF4922 domain-containing protein [Prolixibacteraceae bacterium]|nr:DUF4922 domain-containing protein [Prolixibacteraceae bacterium]